MLFSAMLMFVTVVSAHGQHGKQCYSLLSYNYNLINLLNRQSGEMHSSAVSRVNSEEFRMWRYENSTYLVMGGSDIAWEVNTSGGAKFVAENSSCSSTRSGTVRLLSKSQINSAPSDSSIFHISKSKTGALRFRVKSLDCFLAMDRYGTLVTMRSDVEPSDTLNGTNIAATNQYFDFHIAKARC